VNKAVDDVRASEARQLRAMAMSPSSSTPAGASSSAPKPHRHPARQAHGRTPLQLRSVRAYLLKESLDAFWQYDSALWASWFLDKWCTRALRSRLEPMKKIARTLRSHHDLILNWFIAKREISSGAVEA